MQMSAAMRQILFNDQSAAYGQRFGPSDNPLAAFRKAKRILPVARRAGEVSQDIADVASGREKRPGQKRFWEKSWFHNALLAGAIATPIAVLRHQARKTADLHGHAMVPLAARERSVAFDLAAHLSGWDVRDPRGKSARVFAPGSRRRDRREKNWGEKVDNIRLERNLALLAAGAGVGASAYLFNKSRSRNVASEVGATAARKLVQFPKVG
jgi:hypothetical protein